MPMDYGFNFEAWTLPNVGAYTKKFDITKALESWDLSLRHSGNGEGTFEIDRSFPRLSDLITVDSANHANDVGSMIRIKRGNTYIKGGDFVLYELNRKNDSDKSTYPAILQGPEYLLDLTKVRRFDDPVNPSLDPDWEYGSPTIIRPLGDETVKEVQIIWRSAGMTSGTWDLVFGGQTTVPMAWDVDSSTMRTELENLSTITDVDVSGSGTALDPWTVTFVDPGGDVALLAVGTNGTDGSFSISELTPGGSLSPRPWHQSYHPVTGVQHGNYQAFAIDTTTVFPGDTYSLKLDPDSLPFATDYAGAQVIENVVGGRSYNAKIPVLSEGVAQTVRLVIRDMQENFIAASPDVLVPADTWTWLEVPNPFVLGANIEEIIYRVGVIESGNAAPVYIGIEQATMIPGYYPAPVGAILNDQVQTLNLEGDLTWVTTTWTDTLDSAGNAWDQDRQWKITHKQSILQVLEYALKWGYRFSFYYHDASGEFRWDMFNPGAGPVISGVSLKSRESVGGGDNPIRFPKATLFDAEGAFGEWAEFEDTVMSTAWGRVHGHLRDDRGLDQVGLLDLATEQIEAAKRGADAASLTFQNPDKLPFDAYQLGDQVEFDASPLGTKRTRVVTMVNISKGPGEAAPKYTIHGDTEVFASGVGAMASNVRTLIRKVDSLGQGAGIEKRERTWDPAMFNFGSETIGAGGGIPYLIVASNAPQEWKDVAQYQCDGVDDWPTINQAINDARNVGNVGSRILFSPGDFNIDDNAGSYSFPILDQGFTIEGCGMEVTTLNLIGTTTADTTIFSGLSSVTIRDFTIIDGGGFTHRVDLFGMSDECVLERVSGYVSGSFATMDGTTHSRVSDCIMDGGGGHSGAGISPAIEVGGPPVACEIVGNVITNWFDNGSASIYMVEPGFTQYLTGNIVANNVIRTSQQGGGIHWRSTGGSMFGDLIVNNMVSGANDHGIYVESLLTGRIGGNIVTNQDAGDSIRVEDSGAGVEPVIVSDNVVSRSLANGIHILGSSEALLVAGNFIHEVSNAGILLAGTLEHPYVVSNKIIPETTERGIYISASTVNDAAVVGNDLRPPPSAGAFTIAPITDSGTNTVLDWPADVTYGDNFT